MSEEIKEEATETETKDYSKQLDELSKVADEEATTEEPTIPEKTIETAGEAGLSAEDINNLKSGVGRMDSLQSQVATLSTQLGEALDHIKTLSAPQGQVEDTVAEEATEEDDYDWDFPTTKKDFYKEVRSARQTDDVMTRQEQENYEVNYMKEIDKIKIDEGLDQATHNAVWNEMMGNQAFNKKPTKDPATDARLNYAKAQTSLINKSRAGILEPIKTSPLNGGETAPLDSGSPSTNNESRGEANMDLSDDEYASDYVKFTGMNKEKVANALTKPLPLHIMQGGKASA